MSGSIYCGTGVDGRHFRPLWSAQERTRGSPACCSGMNRMRRARGQPVILLSKAVSGRELPGCQVNDFPARDFAGNRSASLICAIKTSSCSRLPQNALDRASRSAPDPWSTSHTGRTGHPGGYRPTDTPPNRPPLPPDADRAWRSP